MRVLVTGAAGFIGYHLADRLARDGHEVICVDSFSAYYDVTLKEDRAEQLGRDRNVTVERLDLAKPEVATEILAAHSPEVVYHLAAQPGVRYSLEAPLSYVDSNLTAFAHVLEACRRHPPRHLLYASSSSVYGANTSHPSEENTVTDHPLSLYAATKKANEALAHSYSHIFGLACTGLRLFTVYGEWGRPDMALFRFADTMRAGQPLTVHNHGRMKRDFTYVGDVVEALVRLADKPPAPDAAWQGGAPLSATSGVAPYRVLNIGNGKPEELMHCIQILADALECRPELNMAEMQPGEVETTWADTSALQALTGFVPTTSVEQGIDRFAHWYLARYANRVIT